jgi:hypothetical protein
MPRRSSRSIYEITDAELASEFVDQLGIDLQDESCPPEVRSLGRTIVRWRDQIVAWHRALVSNGPTEAINNLIKRIKRVSVNRPSEPDVLGVRAVVAIGWGHWCCAHAWRWAMWVERTDGGYRIEGGPPVEGALANGLLSRLETRSFSPLTVRAYAFHVLSFLRFCDEQGLALASVTPMDLFDFSTGSPSLRPTRSSTCVPRRFAGDDEPADRCAAGTVRVRCSHRRPTG